jgi:3-hydroxyisobutyrate dehydrogenase-like beta-hydroxyacid dehydrogenase
LKHPVGIIGVGNMGGAMAANLLSHDWPVHVCDINAFKTQHLAQQGAVVDASPAEMASKVTLLIVCVVNGEQTQDVLFGKNGAAQYMKSGQVVMLCPTISPEDVEVCTRQLVALGIETIDAPMSGGPARARDGSMSLMVACADAVFGLHQTLLQTLSNQVFRISQRPGDGARTKLVNNMLAGINLAGAAEVMALSERMGLDLTTTLNVIQQSSGQSWIGNDRMRRAIDDDFEPRAHTTLLAKDTKLAVAAAQALGFKTPLGKLTTDTFARALAHGLAGQDDASLIKLMRFENSS